MKLCEVKVTYNPKIKASERPKISSSYSATKYLKEFWEDIEYIEKAYVLLLNRNNNAIGYKLLSIGGVAGTVIDPIIIFQTALKCNASGIILAHNHPSGSVKVSAADKDITKKIKSGGRILNIPLLDHIILTRDDFLSFTDENLL
tara:strand:- start:1150 stop:1584 length:435 start_codon:yes stop_codon:yes gene_type:complete